MSRYSPFCKRSWIACSNPLICLLGRQVSLLVAIQRQLYYARCDKTAIRLKEDIGNDLFKFNIDLTADL